MNDQKKTELWQQLVSKHTAAAKAKAQAAGNVAKETTPNGGANGSDTPAVTTTPATPEADHLAAVNKRLDDFEARLVEIGKSVDAAIAKATEIADAAVAKSASDAAVAKAELDKTLTDAKELVERAKATAERIEALAPRGQGRRIDERTPVGKGAGDPPDDGALLAQRTAEVLNIGKK